MTPSFRRQIEVLVAGEVSFILVGGVAAIVHGAARATFDLDIVYERSRANLRALAEALRPFAPYPRDAPPGLPFSLDEATLCLGLNFTLRTSLGSLDLLGEIVGGGDYHALLPHSRLIPAFGHEIHCLDLPKLIEVKRAAGRPKDYEAIAELEELARRRT